MLKKIGLRLAMLLLTASIASACVLFDEIEYDEDKADSDTPPVGNDYWTNGYCPGNTATQEVAVSQNCNGIGLAGCCDANGNALYCSGEKLYCKSCASNVPSLEPVPCSWTTGGDDGYYWCTDTDQGVDPSGTFLKACPAF